MLVVGIVGVGLFWRVFGGSGCWRLWKAGSLVEMVLPFVAVVVGVVLFEATMVMTTTLCGECWSPKRKRPSYGVMWSGARSGGYVGSANGAVVQKDLLQ